MSDKPKDTSMGRKMALYIGAAALAGGSAIALAQASGDNAQSSEWHNAQQLALAELDPANGWRWEPGGLMWRYTEGSGQGPRPTVADTVTVHYAGTFIDGETFDSSYDRGEPATFPLGRLVKAWQVAIPNMAVGDTIELYAPADMAYGPSGRGPIPGGATLKFKVELIDFER